MSRERMAQAELDELAALLKRYCTIELDQWERWSTQTPYGTVYITITRELGPGDPPSSFDSMDSN